jgi:hypothetical protein
MHVGFKKDPHHLGRSRENSLQGLPLHASQGVDADYNDQGYRHGPGIVAVLNTTVR